MEETHEHRIFWGIFTQSAHRTRIIAAYLLFEVYYNMPINEIMQATISERPLPTSHLTHSGLAEFFHTLLAIYLMNMSISDRSKLTQFQSGYT